jgi:hypothetical protein
MKKILRKLALFLSGHANKLCPERNAAVDSENVTSNGSYNLVHGLSSSNHSFWRGIKIDMHLCCCKETNFQNRFQTMMLFPMAGSAAET